MYNYTMHIYGYIPTFDVKTDIIHIITATYKSTEHSTLLQSKTLSFLIATHLLSP